MGLGSILDILIFRIRNTDTFETFCGTRQLETQFEELPVKCYSSCYVFLLHPLITVWKYSLIFTSVLTTSTSEEEHRFLGLKNITTFICFQ